jgi:hypothetical protein
MPGTTPIYGFPYPEPTDLVADYPALGQQLAEDIEDVLPDLGGLVPVSPTSVTNSGGSASSVSNFISFSGVNSVSVNGIFTSAYYNYRVVFNVVASAQNNQRFRLRAAGTDSSAASYSYSYNGAYINGTDITVGVSGQTGWVIWQSAAGFYVGGNLEFFYPQVAASTTCTYQFYMVNSVNQFAENGGGIHNVSTAYDGFSLIADAGTLSGSFSVYGYRK